MQHSLFLIAYHIVLILFASCDPSNVFTHSKTLSISIENNSNETISWDCNWGKFSNGQVHTNKGIIYPGEIQSLWENIEIPYETSSAYEYFIETINKNTINPSFTLYLYDTNKQTQSLYINKWSLSKFDEDTFFKDLSCEVLEYAKPIDGSHIGYQIRFRINQNLIPTSQP